MTNAEKAKIVKTLDARIKKIHAKYMAEFKKLKKRQMDLLKAVRARVEEKKISDLKKAIGINR